jgi:hypothetical protein
MNSLVRLLPALVRQAEDSPEAREYAAFAAWNAAAGEGVRRVCAPVRLDARRLLVATVDQTWKVQLGRLAPQLIFRLNSLAGAPLVTQISFRVDPAAVAAARPPSPEPFARGDAEAHARALEGDAGVIADPGLRDIFLRAAGRCLARQGASGPPRRPDEAE